MQPSQSPTPPESPDDLAAVIHRTLRTAWIAVAMVALALSAIAVNAVMTDRPSVQAEASTAPENMVAVAPGGVLAAEDVPPAMAAHYQAAQEHMDVFEAMPCVCGCEEMLDHRHLADCFVRADGQDLEAHAVGCGVCLGEAQQVMNLLAAGVEDPDQIKETIVAEWGDPYTDR